MENKSDPESGFNEDTREVVSNENTSGVQTHSDKHDRRVHAERNPDTDRFNSARSSASPSAMAEVSKELQEAFAESGSESPFVTACKIFDPEDKQVQAAELWHIKQPSGHL